MKKAFAMALIVGLVIYGVLNADFITSNQSGNNENRDIGLEKGNIAPDFKLTTITGEEIQVSSLRGKKVMLNFWATWCPPCRDEMPEMVDFYKDHKGEIEILAVNITNSEIKRSDVEKFVHKFQLNFPVLMDVDGTVSSDKYQVVTIPTTYFLDSRGKIYKKIKGPMTYDLMESTIANMN